MSTGESATLNLPRARRQGPRPYTGKLANTVRPFVSALAVLSISGMLVVTIFFTRLSVQWVTFLTGVLVAAVLAEATRVSRAEWALLRRTAQLSTAKDKLERETRLRKASEYALSAAKPRVRLLDEALSTMVLFVDAEGRCRYHNRAFRDWLHFRPEQIDGLHLNEVLGARVYQEIASSVRHALEGQTVKYERFHKLPDGSAHRLTVTHVPQYAEGGQVVGFHMVADEMAAGHDACAEAPGGQNSRHTTATAPAGELAAGNEAAEILAAIEKNEFRLFCQEIAPLGPNNGRAEFYEILMRLMEEEEGMIPPGAFFPLAEKLGMMPRLDRWVVQHVAERIATRIQQETWAEGSVYFINLSDASIVDPGFVDYVEVTLLEYGIPGATLCFEMPSSALVVQAPGLAEFAMRISQCGARVAFSGFGREASWLEAIRGTRVDFMKIDGGVLLGLPDDPAAAASIKAITAYSRPNWTLIPRQTGQ